MPDHDAPDPIDQAYVQAESMLSDDAARTARRARVLAAVAQAPAPSLAAAAPAVAAPAPAPAPATRRPAWRPGGWLAVACVVGLSVFLAVKLYQPTPFQQQTTPATPKPAAPGPTASTPVAATLAPAQTAVSQPPPSTKTREIAATPAAPEPAAPSSESSAREAPDAAAAVEKPAPTPLALAPIAPPPAAPAPQAFPAPAPPPPPVVASEQAETPRTANYPASVASGGADETAKVQGSLSAPAQRRAAFAAAPLGGSPSDQAARLRDAAAAGRTAEVVDLLEHGAPVDAPDAAGDTALMKSIQADHPAAAAALRRHGASLDHRNHAGKSARDLAATKEDSELDQAIGVGP